MNSFLLTAEEVSTELAEALKDVTKEQAFTGGTVLGMALGMAVTFGIIIFILQVIADWKIFTKAGVAGWKSLIPFLCDYEEYKLCWKGSLGLVAAICLAFINYVTTRVKSPNNGMVILMGVLGIVALVLSFLHSQRLSRAFGKGAGFGVGLFLLGPIFRLILGFGSARYVGHPDR
jgi:hypothetical protein